MNKRVVQLLSTLLAVSFLGWACADNESAGPERGTDVGDITGAEAQLGGSSFFDDPPRYFGKTVTISGSVSDVLGPTAFRIAGEDAGGEAVLVVSNERLSVKENDLVRITGTVKLFDRRAFERELHVDLSGAAFDDFTADSAVAASSVNVLEPADAR